MKLLFAISLLVAITVETSYAASLYQARYQQATCSMQPYSCWNPPTFGARCFNDAQCQEKFGSTSRCCVGCNPDINERKYCTNMPLPVAASSLDEKARAEIFFRPRQSTFCPLFSGLRFTFCKSLCPPTCEDPNPSCPDLKDEEGCYPGCVCPEGKVLHERRLGLFYIFKQCIPPEECPSARLQDVPQTTPPRGRVTNPLTNKASIIQQLGRGWGK